MWDWLTSSFASDPAGWISVALTIAAAILSAVFWRRVWGAVRAVGTGVSRFARAVGRVRLTTVDNLKPPPTEFFPEPRWLVTKAKGSGPHEFQLVNAGEGSIARNVRLDSLSDDVQLASAAAWPEIPGGMAAKFLIRARDGAFWIGVYFRVEWIDVRGQAREHSWIERR